MTTLHRRKARKSALLIAILWIVILGVCWVFALAVSVRAEAWTPPACMEQIADYWRIPPSLIHAIVQIESGGDPIALNVNSHGQGRRELVSSKRDAERRIARLLRERANFDVGLGQINVWTAISYGVHPAWMLDPCWNLFVTARHLREKIDRHGYNWTAIERYNGINPRYPWKVYGQLRRMAGSR
ncbi:MAG: lytic transglycosylase domain-containing protein [Nitrospirota bacterium]